ncbi:MAG: hypothetical protein Q7J85_03520 [Bacillota bacterium]|nr:hypothetical protein [Bacillota bacterium]
MNTYTFILRNQDGEQCCHIPKAIIERNYGLLEEDTYIFHTPPQRPKSSHLSERPSQI